MHDSTTLSTINTKANIKAVKTPNQSSLQFIRQFARVYNSTGKSELTTYILN